MSSGSLTQKKSVSKFLATKQETQSKWVPIKKLNNFIPEESEMSTEYGHMGVKPLMSI